jgi:hypothetical protein
VEYEYTATDPDHAANHRIGKSSIVRFPMAEQIGYFFDTIDAHLPVSCPSLLLSIIRAVETSSDGWKVQDNVRSKIC